MSQHVARNPYAYPLDQLNDLIERQARTLKEEERKRLGQGRASRCKRCKAVLRSGNSGPLCSPCAARKPSPLPVEREIKCPVCPEIFIPNGHQEYCSPECQSVASELRKIERNQQCL
jgi:hypothetical protein